MTQIAHNLETLDLQIAKAAKHSKRDPDTIQLLAVSKKQPHNKILAALSAGHRHYGENRVQEAAERWSPLKPEYPDLELHLIGPLQTNKVKDAVTLFDCIQTLDREKLANALSHEMEKQHKTIPCLIQVNTGEEDQKSGVLPKHLDQFYISAKEKYGLTIQGLMCIPPANSPPAIHFAFLHKLARDYGFKHLSMGMTGDFDKAIPLGATYIRVGTGVFGAREV